MERSKFCRVRIRAMVRTDLSAVVAIERRSFAFPWTRAEFALALRRRTVMAEVAETWSWSSGWRVVGYVMCDLRRLSLLSVCVEPASRRRGIGIQLLDSVFGALRKNGRAWVSCTVRESNLEAQLFLRRASFRATQILADHYEGTSEAAYVFVWCLPAARATPLLAPLEPRFRNQ